MKFVDRKQKNPNDCWNCALALATGKKYEIVREELKVFIKDNGCIIGDVVYSYLWRHGFKSWSIDKRASVEELVEVYDTYNNHIVVDLEGHTSYITNETLYDFEDIADKKVIMIFTKRK